MANGRNESNRGSSWSEFFRSLVETFGPKPVMIVVLTVLLMLLILSSTYSVYSLLNRSTYHEISELTGKQIVNLKELFNLNEKLFEQNKILKGQNEKLEKDIKNYQKIKGLITIQESTPDYQFLE